MLIKRTRGWELPERAATAEGLYLKRREIVAAMGLGAMTIAAPGLALAQDDPSATKYPAPRNDKFGKPEPITDEKLATCLLYTSPSPRDGLLSRMPSSA